MKLTFVDLELSCSSVTKRFDLNVPCSLPKAVLSRLVMEDKW